MSILGSMAGAACREANDEGEMAGTLIVTERPHWCRATVWHGEDWYDAWPQLVHPVTGEGILKETPASGLVSIFVTLEQVEAELPLTNGVEWQQFCRITFDDTQLGGDLRKLLWTGPLIVLPAKDSATPP
jgi:hypothetical protein